jgi:hypothetical protein
MDAALFRFGTPGSPARIFFGAGDRIRTGDVQLGKLTFYL